MFLKIGRVIIGAFGVISSMACAVNCEYYRYESRGRRDPFIPLVGFEKPAVVKLEDVESVDDLMLEGIASESKGKRIAIINGRMMRENEKAGTVEVKKITDSMVTLLMSGQAYNIKLPEKGGGRKE